MPKVEELIRTNVDAAKFLQQMVDTQVCKIDDDIEECLKKISLRDEEER